MRCLYCECTDEHACEGGCFWVFGDEETRSGICSACVLRQLQIAALTLDDQAKHYLVGELLIAAGEIRNSMGSIFPDNPTQIEHLRRIDEQEPSHHRLWRPGDPI